MTQAALAVLAGVIVAAMAYLAATYLRGRSDGADVTKQKIDEQELHDVDVANAVEREVADMSDADVERRLRTNWTRAD